MIYNITLFIIPNILKTPQQKKNSLKKKSHKLNNTFVISIGTYYNIFYNLRMANCAYVSK